MKAQAVKSPKDSEDQWQADSDMDTLMRAEEIKQDKDRMKKVGKRAGRKHKAISSIKDLVSHYNTKYGPKDDLGDMGE